MSHFRAIGFDTKNQEEFREMIKNIIISQKNKYFKVNKGTYIQYADSSGAELWIQDSGKGSGVHPFLCWSVKEKGKNRKEDKEGIPSRWYVLCLVT